jgi:predicted murein hydrolase (TIGR00659 family)
VRGHIGEIWVYLQASPLLWLTVTVGTYALAAAFYRRSGNFPFAHPVLVSVVAIVALLRATHVSYARYFEGAQFVHFLLGPATVALALPLYHNLGRVRRSLLPIVAAIAAGSFVAMLSGMWIARSLGAGTDVVLSIAPKSVTTPVAMAISEQLGGLPSLTAALVILTGITGAVLAAPLFAFARIRDERARGLALGTAAHGIGTARALQESHTAGAFAGLAMGVNALISAVVLPWLVPLLLR